MVKLITISKDGKITIPKDVIKEIGIKGEEQYVLVAGEGNLLLKRVSPSRNRDKMLELLANLRVNFKNAGLTKKDIEREIKAVRAAQNK